MYRYKINELIQWKLSGKRKPLIILGARQVGKTWLIQEFGRKEYRQMVYVNFEKMKMVRHLFEEDFDIQRILASFSLFGNKWGCMWRFLEKENVTLFIIRRITF